MNEPVSLQESILNTKSILYKCLDRTKCIDKSFINEKLLSRPPFSFIHALVKIFVEQLSFSVGLFTLDELNLKHPFSRQDKIRFLVKILACVSSLVNERLDILISPAKVLSGQDVRATLFFLRTLANATYRTSDESSNIALKIASLDEKDLYRQAVRARNALVKAQAIIRGKLVLKKTSQKYYYNSKINTPAIISPDQLVPNREQRNYLDKIKSKSDYDNIRIRDKTKKKILHQTCNREIEHIDEEKRKTPDNKCYGHQSGNSETSSSKLSNHQPKIDLDKRCTILNNSNRGKNDCMRNELEQKECLSNSNNGLYDIKKDLNAVNNTLDEDMNCLKVVMTNERNRQMARLRDRLNDTHSTESLNSTGITPPPPVSTYDVLSESTNPPKNNPYKSNRKVEIGKCIQPKNEVSKKETNLSNNPVVSQSTTIADENKNYELLMKKMREKEMKLKKKIETTKEKEDMVIIQEHRVQRLAEQLRKQKEKFMRQKQEHMLVLDQLKHDSERRKRKINIEKHSILDEHNNGVLPLKDNMKPNPNNTDLRLKLERKEMRLERREKKLILMEKKLLARLSDQESKTNAVDEKKERTYKNYLRKKKINIQHDSTTVVGTSRWSVGKKCIEARKKEFQLKKKYSKNRPSNECFEESDKSSYGLTNSLDVSADNPNQCDHSKPQKIKIQTTSIPSSVEKDEMVQSQISQTRSINTFCLKSKNSADLEDTKNVKFDQDLDTKGQNVYKGKDKRVEAKVNRQQNFLNIDTNEQNLCVEPRVVENGIEKVEEKNSDDMHVVVERRNGAAIESFSQAAIRYKGFKFSFDKGHASVRSHLHRKKNYSSSYDSDLARIEETFFQ